MTGYATVVLHKDCIDHGGAEEYPHLWVVKMGDIADGRLVQCKLPHPFVGKSAVSKKRETKTDWDNRMYIPQWLLRPIGGAA